MNAEPVGKPEGDNPPLLAPEAAGWDPEDALNEVIAAIKTGSLLDITDDVADGLKERYRPDFEAQARMNADWSFHKQLVLPVARVVGAWATTLTMLQAVRQRKAIPPSVDAQSAYTAAYLVAKSGICPAGAPAPGDEPAASPGPAIPHPPGAYCTSVPPTGGNGAQLEVPGTLAGMKALLAGLDSEF